MDEWRTPHLKLVLVGNSGLGYGVIKYVITCQQMYKSFSLNPEQRVGKSSIMTRFVDHRFTNMYRATIGVDFLTKEVDVDKKRVILQVWDTAGSERFHSLGSALYRGAHCCLLVFDLSSAASFSALDMWRTEFLLQATPADHTTFPFIVVSSQRVRQWCENLGAEYFECSAKEDTDVDMVFKSAARAALKYFKCNVVENTENIRITTKETENQSNHSASKCTC